MKAAALVLLLWIHSIVLLGLIKPVMSMFGFTIDPIVLALFISLLGIGLGSALYYSTKYLPLHIRRYLKISLFTVYPLILLITYLVFDLSTFFGLIVFIVKVIFIVLLSSMALLITYGILKKSNITIVAPGFGMIFLYFLIRGISGEFPIDVEGLWLFILFFILFLLFLELATMSVNFSCMVEKITPHKTENLFLLERFTRVFHAYFLYLSVALILCGVVTAGIVLLKDFFLSSNSVIIMGLNLRSLSGLYLFVVFTIIGVLLFWLLVPMKKNGLRLGLNKIQTK